MTSRQRGASTPKRVPNPSHDLAARMVRNSSPRAGVRLLIVHVPVERHRVPRVVEALEVAVPQDDVGEGTKMDVVDD